MNIKSIKSTIYLYIIFALILLLCVIIFSPDKMVFDERFFIPNIKTLEQYGFSFAFLRNMTGQSPGPLYQYIYYSIGHIIPLTPKSMRVINYFFLLGNLYLLQLLARMDQEKNAILVPLLIVGIPMTWSISGMAMTEWPSLFFCLLSVLLLRKALATHTKFSFALSALAGLSAGTAIIGRSPFLMVLPAAFMLYSLPHRKNNVSIFILSSMIFPAILFYAWKGLVPPDLQSLQSGFNLTFLCLGFLYFAITTIIIYPGLFNIKRIHYFIGVIVIILSFIINAFFFKLSYTPMNGVVTSNLIPQSVRILYPYIFFPVAFGASYIFLVSLLIHFIENEQNTWRLFYLIISILIMVTTIKSTAHFSSRYVMQAYPFFLLYIASNIKINKYLLIRIVIGTIIGIISLYRCYQVF